MSLHTLTFRTVTYCTDQRCVTSRRCWREENEDFGNAPGENYGPRCVPVPAFDLARGAELVYALGIEEGERRAQEAFRADIERYGSQLEAAHDRGVAAERAAVVAWLREHWSEVLEQTPQQTARLIERGEHRREEQR